MQVLFIHPNFPGQFAHIAAYLTTRLGWKCTVLTSVDTSTLNLPFQHLNYRLKDGPLPKVFYNPDNLQAMFDHLLAIYKGLRNHRDFQPDLVVGHMSYGTMLYLRNLYACPFVGYYELLPPPFWSDGMILRKEFPPTEQTRLFNATYHTMTHLHLNACDAGYTPTNFQKQTAPTEYQYKLNVIFDGIDTDTFQRRELPRPTTFRGIPLDADTRIVTYVSRGLESVRGFDIFMQVAKRIYQAMPNVVFLIAGKERTNYGHELAHIGNQSFKQYVLAQDDYDLTKFHFLDLIPTAELPVLYSLSDLHIYLTVPYVLSWSMMQAMATGCVILGSATPPVQEVLQENVNGLLAGFDDVDTLTQQALAVLRDPAAYRHLGDAARQTILERYELRKSIDQLVSLFEQQGARTPSR